MAVKGKLKGGAFERSVCKSLSLWVSEGWRDDLFWRSALSGGRATVQFRKGSINLTQSGDISAVSPEGSELIENYYIECKDYRDLRIDSSILNNQGELHRFWVETVRQSKNYKKVAVLIAKQNRLPAMLWTQLSCGLFGSPLLVIPKWDAKCYLFDKVMMVSRETKVVRRLAV